MTSIDERIRDTGLRVTRQRVLVYDALAALGGHRTADELVSALDAAGTALPRATVYNVLDDLSTVGLVMQADRGPGAAVYEAANGWHHHFVCRVCGAVEDVPCVIGSKPCIDTDVPGAAIDEAQIIFRGVCASCRAAG